MEDKALYSAIIEEAIDQCSQLKDRFTILDFAYDEPLADFRNRLPDHDLSYGAAYTPFLQVNKPLVLDESKTKVSISWKNNPKFKVTNLQDLASHYNILYKAIYNHLPKLAINLPPSPAIAGLYCATDRNRGVWKAPANIHINGITGLSKTITHQENEPLNVDPISGKSINAIRKFSGRGTLVWGGRTLAGIDHEWRYISVRRFAIMIQESITKSATFAVFEPNDANTWLKLKAMTEQYLNGLWRNGALAGANPSNAYFVKIGLHETMTQQDILEGRLIMEYGLAMVRPAEFIIQRIELMIQ